MEIPSAFREREMERKTEKPGDSGKTCLGLPSHRSEFRGYPIPDPGFTKQKTVQGLMLRNGKRDHLLRKTFLRTEVYL